jgi:AraC-like DNA-binding protein
MPSLPLPFVVAMLLTILLIRLARRKDRGRADYALVAFIGTCAAQALVSGLRWSYDWPYAHNVQPMLAAALPPVAWIGFSSLHHSSGSALRAAWPHFLPVAVVGLLTFALRQALDVALMTLFIGYGLALIWSVRRRSDRLEAARLGEEDTARRALLIAGFLLIISGLIDIGVAFNLSTDAGVPAETLVAIANLVMLVIVGYAAATADGSRPTTEAAEDSGAPVVVGLGRADASDHQIIAAIDALMRERQLYRDHNLTLERLARRAGVPARQISNAVNRVHGRNVSQIVNEYRVAEAKRRLAETEEPITTVMLESGFQTKSNFNREFLRVTGMRPSDYRRSSRHGGNRR